MPRKRILGLCLVAAFAMSAIATASASAQPEFYQKVSACTKKFGPVWSGGLCKGVSKPATKITFTSTGGEGHLEGALKITCKVSAAKGDIEGSTKIVKVKIVFKECHKTGTTTPCGKYTNATVGGEIKTEPIKGETARASEESGGPTSVVERLEPEKTLFAKFTCGLTGHTQNVEVKGKIFALSTPVQAVASEGALSTSGTTGVGQKAVIPGCGGQQYLYENGTGACHHLEVVENGTALEPSWQESTESLTYKTAIELVE